MRKTERLFIAVIFLLLALGAALSGCASPTPKLAAPLPAEVDARTAAAHTVPSEVVGVKGTPTPKVLAAPRQDPAQEKRVVIYKGSLFLVVDNIAASLKMAQELAEKAGGYMQKLSGTSITVKIPVEKFNDTMAAIASLGEVIKRDIIGSDVTEEMHDLRIRLANSERVRERLLKILEKAETTKDALEVEKELGRVTEEIERLKGRINFLAQSAAYATLEITFNSVVPQDQIALEIPFKWVRELGDEIGTGRATEVHIPHKARERGIEFELPKNFIKYHERGYITRAMSADGVLIRLQRQENVEGGTLTFWSQLSRRVLVERKGIALDEGMEIVTKEKSKMTLFSGSREVAGKKYGYLIALGVSEDYIYIVEAWGEKDKFAAAQKEVEKAVKTIRIR